MLLGGCYGQVVAKVNCIPYLVNSRKFMHATRSIVIASLSLQLTNCTLMR